MARCVLESLSGVGQVFAGDLLLRETRYELSVWVDDDAAQPGDDSHARVDGSIDITGIGEAVVLAGPRELTLRLEDGRRLTFVLTDSGGGLVGRGGLSLS